MEQERSEEQKAVTLIQELLRMHTQSVRNWGYFDKVVRIVNQLYKPLDEEFAKHIGLAATQIAAVFLFLVRNSEQKVNAQWKKLRQVLIQKNVTKLVRKYYELNPDFEDTADDMIAVVSRRRLTMEQTKFLILAHSDFRLMDAFRFSTSTIAGVFAIDEARITKLMQKLSLTFGDLQAHNTEHLLLDNPVWRKPVIDLGRGQYFCAIPQSFFSFVRPILDDLVDDNPVLQHACEDRRAEFLETEIAQLFATAFPLAQIVAGFKWKEGDTEYENDLLIRIDSHLLIVEAKSGTISWPALRGAPGRAKRHIEDLFIAPSIQSARLAERVKAVLISPELQKSYLPDLDIQLDRVHTVLRLSVTLEDFAMVQANLFELRDTEWPPPAHTLAPCIMLTDLEIVFDILEPPGQKLNYMLRRTELAFGLKTAGDELDHLGFYLSTGFNIGEAEFSGPSLQLIGMSKEIDDFCTARAEGRQIKKPRLQLSKWWSAICSTIERRGFARWTDAYNILLSLSPEEQEKAEKMFKAAKRNARANRNEPSRNDSVFAIPARQKTNAVALYAFRNEDSGIRRERMQSISAEIFDNVHVTRCVVVAVNVDRDEVPYSTLGMFFRDDLAERPKLDDLVIY